MVRKVGSALGLSESDVAALEGAFHAENGAKNKRIEVIFPGRAPGDVPAADPATLSEAWVMHEYYGVDTPPSAEDIAVYAKLLLCIANSDGNISPAEREWVMGFAACSGVSPEGLELLSTYSGDDDIESLIQQSKVVADARRAIVYDAIRACDADAEYSDAERAAVHEAAQRLGVTSEVVAEIESAWAAEKTAKLARQALVFPQISELAAAMGS
jgi:tellurite resistance protein